MTLYTLSFKAKKPLEIPRAIPKGRTAPIFFGKDVFSSRKRPLISFGETVPTGRILSDAEKWQVRQAFMEKLAYVFDVGSQDALGYFGLHAISVEKNEKKDGYHIRVVLSLLTPKQIRNTFTLPGMPQVFDHQKITYPVVIVDHDPSMDC